MSIQLKIDEMLDFLESVDHSEAQAFIRRVEHLADDLADAVADTFPELTRCGPAHFEGTAFAGTCAPFEPTAPGPVPEVLLEFDVEVQQWKDMVAEPEEDREAYNLRVHGLREEDLP